MSAAAKLKKAAAKKPLPGKMKQKTERRTKEEKRSDQALRKKIEHREKAARKSQKKAAKLVAKKYGKKHDAKISFKASMQREEAVAYFEAIVSGLKKGSIQFKNSKDAVVIHPAKTVDVKVMAEIKGKIERVTFNLTWKRSHPSLLSIS